MENLFEQISREMNQEVLQSWNDEQGKLHKLVEQVEHDEEDNWKLWRENPPENV